MIHLLLCFFSSSELHRRKRGGWNMCLWIANVCLKVVINVKPMTSCLITHTAQPVILLSKPYLSGTMFTRRSVRLNKSHWLGRKFNALSHKTAGNAHCINRIRFITGLQTGQSKYNSLKATNVYTVFSCMKCCEYFYFKAVVEICVSECWLTLCGI